MAFENLTLFEVNLENSRFGASRGESGSEETDSAESESGDARDESASESGGRSKALPLGVVLFLVIGGLAFRRYRSGGDDETEVGTDETEGITIEQAAEQ